MQRESRMMCVSCPIDTITQGSIFNGASNEDFNSSDDLGMIITARCDLANNKAKKYSYLPVVKLEKYVSCYLSKKLLVAEYKQELQKIKNLIKNEKHSPEAVDMFGVKECIEKLLENKTNIKKANESYAKMEKICSALERDWKYYGESEFGLISPKKIKQELRELSQNKVEGFFLIDEVVDYNDCQAKLGPHVVLLREVHHMSSNLADFLRKGFYHEDVKRVLGDLSSLVTKKDGFSYVLCNIKSPYVELIMQRFSILYTRIGVKDPSEKMVDEFANKYIKE